jgi:hypothetical protein
MLYKLQRMDFDGTITDIREISREHQLLEAQSECDCNYDLHILAVEGLGKLNGRIIYPDENRLFADEGRDEADLRAQGYVWICPYCGIVVREIESTDEAECLNCESEYKADIPEQTDE